METAEPAVIRAAPGQAISRREFVSASAAGLLSLSRRGLGGGGQPAAVTLGVQSYSFRDRPLDDAIAGMNAVGFPSCELWQGHVEPNGDGAELRKWRETASLDTFHRIRDRFAKARIILSAYNISITDAFSDLEIERAFDMAAALGVTVITSSSNIATVARIAPVAERRKVVVGMHNHENAGTNEFATAKSLSDALQKGRFIGVNLDVGHFTAANEDAVAFLNQYHSRIVSLHLKDRKRNQGPNVEMGTGDAPISGVLRLLRDHRWRIPLNLEYEYDGGDAVAELRKMRDYCRRALNL